MPKRERIYLLDASDIQEIRLISDNIDDRRIEPYIYEAQRKELRDLVGDEIYNALKENYNASTKTFPTFKYDALWYGTTYVYNDSLIEYEGLLPCISYYAYARFLNNQKLNVTRYGVKSMQNEFSEDIEDPRIKEAYRNAMSMAQNYAADGVRFLQSAKNEEGTQFFPEWRKKERRARSAAFEWIPMYYERTISAPSLSGKAEVTPPPPITNTLPITLPHTFI